MSPRSGCRTVPTQKRIDASKMTWYGTQEWLQMLDPCHHCGKPLEEGQGLVVVGKQWVHKLCESGEGPASSQALGGGA
jgi:hypothetical protein